jgi:hypothetical protein
VESEHLFPVVPRKQANIGALIWSI